MKRGSIFVLSLFLILTISLSLVSAGFFSDFFDGITGKATSDACGNNIMEGTELCDGTDLGSFSCSNFGFVGGVLGCNSNCGGFDTIQCTTEQTVICGNGILEPGEQCDGNNFGSITCGIFGYPFGELICSDSCLIDTSKCSELLDEANETDKTPSNESIIVPDENETEGNVTNVTEPTNETIILNETSEPEVNLSIDSKAEVIEEIKPEEPIKCSGLGGELKYNEEGIVENSYIVEYKEPSVLEFKAQKEEDIENKKDRIEILDERIERVPANIIARTERLFTNRGLNSEIRNLEESIKEQKENVRETHERLENYVSSRGGIVSFIGRVTGQAIREDENLEITCEFELTFSGASIKASEETAERIRGLRYVKEVYPNYKVNITLSDSVPLINADDVWLLDEDGNDCATSGKECLTGKGVTIAIIDTGVDYTHEDLGGSTPIEDRDFNKITDQPLSLFFSPSWGIDQTLGMDSNRVVYYSGNKIFVHSLETGQITTIDPFAENLKVVRLVIKNNLLLYFATDPELIEPTLYLYDLDSKVHKKIASSIEIIDLISISNGKVVYGARLTGETFSNIYVYDISTETEITIEQGSLSNYMPVASEDLIAYPVYSGGFCYEKAVIYDVKTGEKRDIFPPDIGPILDFKGDKILYVACSKSNFDSKWQTHYLYDINTGEFTKLKYEEEEEDLGGEETNIKGFLGTSSWINKGAIANNLVFFSKDVNANRVIVYDQNQERYVQVNLRKASYDFDADGNTVCFISGDSNIYCHRYNPANNYSIPEFSSFNEKVIGGYDIVNDDDDPMDDHGHGTHVAATAAGNGVLKGVAPDAKILAYKVLSSSGSGTWSGVIAGIERAVDPNRDGNFSDKADIISMSLGGRGNPDDPVSTAVDNAVNSGVVVVIAAGNSGPSPETIGSPGTARKAITVGATTKNDGVIYFSSRGPVVWKDEDGNEKVIIKPDIVAPGVSICAAQWDDAWQSRQCLDDEHTSISGTSMATPHVAGAVALLKQKNPDWTPEEIKTVLKETAVDIGEEGITQGHGRIDVFGAVKLNVPPEMPWDFYVYVDNKINNIYNVIEIKGIFPEDYDSLVVEFYDGISWKSEGITIVGQNGIIAEFNPSSLITETGDYAFMVRISRGGIEKTISVDEIYFDPDLKEGWPIKLEGIAYFNSPTIADVDGDGNFEVIIGKNERSKSYVAIYNSDGTLLEGWPQEIEGFAQYGISIGDINNDNLNEVIASTGGGEQLYVWDYRGNLLWKKHLEDVSHKCTVLEDVNNDGFLEIIVYTLDSKLFVLDYEGNNIAGWPQDVGGYDVAGLRCPSVADFDGDGLKEIVITKQIDAGFEPGDIWRRFRGGLAMYNSDGSIRWTRSWPQQEQETEYYSYGPRTSPVIGDINNDGELEIIIAHEIFNANDFSDRRYRNNYIIFDKEGNVLEGWPLETDSLGDLTTNPVIANLDDDEELEIIGIGKNKLYVWNHDGTLVFDPLELPSSNGEAIIGISSVGDVTGDGKQDILVYSNNNCRIGGCIREFKLHIIESDGGFYTQNWPKTISSFLGTNSPAISDLDNDGKVDIIVHDNIFLYVWETEADYAISTIDWPMFQHDPQHTGCYDCISEPVCGNEVVDSGETCDDGNTINGDGCSSSCQIETPKNPPSPPTNLHASVNEEKESWELTWTDNSNNENYFKIERKGPSDFGYSVLALTLSNAESYEDPIIGFEYYSYRISSCSYSEGCSSTEPPGEEICGNGILDSGEACDGGTDCIATRETNECQCPTGYVTDGSLGCQIETSDCPNGGVCTDYKLEQAGDILIFIEGEEGQFIRSFNGNNKLNDFNFLNTFYSKFEDDFDFLIIYPMVENQLSSNYVSVNQDVGGIELTIFNSSVYRTQRLKGRVSTVFYQSYEFLKNGEDDVLENLVHTELNLLLHEIGHNWCCYLKGFYDHDPDKPLFSSHYINNLDLFYGDQNYNDIHGRSNWIIDNGEESCVDTTNKTFSDLTLYLMGLISPNELRPIPVHDYVQRDDNPFYNERGPQCNEEVEFVGTRLISVQDIIGLHGERIPSYLDSQKEFHVGFIIVAPKNTEINNEFLYRVNQTKNNFPNTWAEATGYRSTFTVERKFEEIETSTICSLESASWSTENTVEGTSVNLDIVTSGCSDGTVISFEVLEDDLLGDDPVSTNPSNKVISGNSATGTWGAEWQRDGRFGGDPEYYFKATIGNNEIKSSDPLLTVTPLPPQTPTAPSKLEGYSSTIDVFLSWSDNSNDETSFEIQRFRSTIDTLGPGSISYIDRDLTPDTSYQYKVRACNSAPIPCSGWSNVFVIATYPLEDPDEDDDKGGGGGGGGEDDEDGGE